MNFLFSRRNFLGTLSVFFSGALFHTQTFGADAASAEQEDASVCPEAWLKEWESPSNKNRPFQIIHGGMGPDQVEGQIRLLKEQCGLGGIVCNVQSHEYLQSEAGWEKFIKIVSLAKDFGLRVWIYDEDGYPSPAAGGVVLQGHPEFEAKELVYDSENANEPFSVRSCYEFTHATNNFCALRRYPNVLNGSAMERFLDVTHREYARRLKAAGLWDCVEAFFTDEPSTNAVNTGVIPNLKVRTIDEPDPNKKNLPMVVWTDDMPEVYREMYGEDLLAVRKSLFTGDSEEDQRVRRQFWQMVAKLYDERFMGKIQKWCAENGKLSSGHALHEEALVYHVPCYGNVFAGTRTMQLAGMDFLSNSPGAGMRGWITAIYPASSNIMNGQRRMMTEISDHNEWFAHKRRATIEEMQFTAAWQMALGCTEFTLYYGVEPRGPKTHKAYCDYVGRINAVIRDAKIEKRALLYYPARDLQEEYRPVAERLATNTQSKRMQDVIAAYYERGHFLMRRQIPFFAADDEMLRCAKVVAENGKAYLQLGNQDRIESVSIPSFTRLPEHVQRLFDEFKAKGGTVVDQNSLHLQEQLPKILSGNTEQIILGEFSRDGRWIYLLTNSNATNEFHGTLKVGANVTECVFMDPKTGRTTAQRVSDGQVDVTLPSLESVLCIVSR